MIQEGYATPICSPPPGGHVHCNGFVLTPLGRQTFLPKSKTQSALKRGTLFTMPPSGFGPSDFQSFYGLTSASATYGTGKTIGIVISGATTTLEADLIGYRSHFGLGSCTLANGCLKILDENGGSNLPIYGGWASEAALDVEMVSAICPLCKMIVFETATSAMSDMTTAVNSAAAMKVSSISLSWGVGETGMASYASAFNHPGIPIVASAGNGNYSSIQEIPAAFSTVISVSGTSPNTGGPTRESSNWGTVGCSTIVAKPSWQHDSLCSTRTVADIAFDAQDIAHYTAGQWDIVGGTSSGPPAIAAILAMAGSTANDASGLYANASQFYDVIDGYDGNTTNGNQAGSSCSPPPDDSTDGTLYSFSIVRQADASRKLMGSGPYPLALCTGQVGYDAATGNGTPNALCGFTPNCIPAGSASPSPAPSVCPAPSPTPVGQHVVEKPTGPGCGSS